VAGTQATVANAWCRAKKAAATGNLEGLGVDMMEFEQARTPTEKQARRTWPGCTTHRLILDGQFHEQY